MSLYAMHRLCKNSQDYVSSFIGTSRARSDGFSLALACVLMTGLELGKITEAKTINISTPAPVQDADVDGVVTQGPVVTRLTSLNEIFRLDPDKVLEYAKKFYKYRLEQLSWSGWVNVIHNDERAVSDFFGITKFFSQADMDLIKAEGDKITHDIMNLNQLFNELGIFNG